MWFWKLPKFKAYESTSTCLYPRYRTYSRGAKKKNMGMSYKCDVHYEYWQ